MAANHSRGMSQPRRRQDRRFLETTYNESQELFMARILSRVAEYLAWQTLCCCRSIAKSVHSPLFIDPKERSGSARCAWIGFGFLERRGERRGC